MGNAIKSDGIIAGHDAPPTFHGVILAVRKILGEPMLFMNMSLSIRKKEVSNFGISVMIVSKNEEKMLPWTLRHYSTFADEIIVYDNMSTDKTAQIITSCPIAKRIPYDTNGVLRDDLHSEMKAQFTSNFNWKIVVDADELLWCKQDIRTYLQNCSKNGTTLPLVQGWDMIGDGWPADDGKSQLWDLIPNGVNGEFATKWYSKPCVVHRSISVKYDAGCHNYEPLAGLVKRNSSPELLLLHYKWIDKDWQLRKVNWAQSTLSEQNRINGWGVRNIQTEIDYYNSSRAIRKNIFQ